MPRKPGRPTEPPTTILTLTTAPAGPVDYTGADLAAVAVDLGIVDRPVPRVAFDPGTHPLHRRFFTDAPWGDVDAPLYAATVAARGVPLPGVVSGVVVEVRDAVAVGA